MRGGAPGSGHHLLQAVCRSRSGRSRSCRRTGSVVGAVAPGDMPEAFTTAPAPPRNHHDVMCRDAPRRYRQMGEWATVPLPGAVLRIPEIGSAVALQTGTGRCQQNCGRTTKPASLVSAIALPAGVVAVCLGGVGFCTQRNTTSPCGGRRSLFFASAKKTNEKKADPAGGRAIRLSNVDDFVVRPGVPAGICRYRFEGPRTCQPPGFTVRPAVADITCFKPSVARVVAGHEVAGAPVPSWARWHRVDMPKTLTTAPAPPRNHHDVMCRGGPRR